MRLALLILLLIWARAGIAATVTGHVVEVAAGDAATVLDSHKARHHVQLAGIDAPRTGQAFADRSRQNLARWILKRDVIVEWHGTDRCGHIIGVVLVDGHDVNLEQVRAGFAWWYRAEAAGQAPDDREVYELAERAARERRLGLWAEPNPSPPWEFAPPAKRPCG